MFKNSIEFDNQCRLTLNFQTILETEFKFSDLNSHTVTLYDNWNRYGNHLKLLLQVQYILTLITKHMVNISIYKILRR